MNVSSSTSTASTSSTQSTQSAATAMKSQDGNTFEQEMKNVDVENKEQDVQQNESASKEESAENSKQADKQFAADEKNILSAGVEVDMVSDAKLTNANLLSLNIQQLLDTQNQISVKGEVFKLGISTAEDLTSQVGGSLFLDTIEMSEGDALFFADVVKNNNAGVQNVVQDIQQALEFGSEEVQKTANVSKTLINALHNSAKTGQAVRIDFGNDVAVIMRIGKDGSIMANFIPGDKAVEECLKNNIDFLRQRFDEEDIKYSNLSYSQHQQRERKQQDNNKENRHE